MVCCDYSSLHTHAHILPINTAGVHYFVNTSGVITIAPPPHGNPCTQVRIMDNDVFDIDGRDFSATLYSSDPSVQITEDTYLIHIGDNDGMLYVTVKGAHF